MTGFPIYEIIFYVFAVLLIGSALIVVLSRNTVYGLLSLILAFFCSAVLWMLMQAEFLSLMLIFVYVGAVMTLFLFVVMMLNINLENLREKFVTFMPFAALIVAAIITIVSLALGSRYLPPVNQLPHLFPAGYSNTKALGTLLFTRYLYPFEIAGMLLLVAMISAIALAFFGPKPGTKRQKISQQHAVKPEDRLKMINMKAEKR